MPPRTRSSTGSLKQIVKYEASIDDSESLDVPVKSARKAKRESESDFADSIVSASESSDSDPESSIDETRIIDGSVDEPEPSFDDATMDEEVNELIFRPVSTTQPMSGKLPLFPIHLLINATQEQLNESITRQIEACTEALKIVSSLSLRFRTIISQIPEGSKPLVLREMSNLLLHHLAIIGIKEIVLFQNSSFIEIDHQLIKSHFSKLQYVTSCLLTGDLVVTQIESPEDPYYPRWLPSGDIPM